MYNLTANKPSVMWDNHTTENDWISWWLSITEFSPWFAVAPRLRPCHYRSLVFTIMPCLLLSFPLAVARCLCNTTYDVWSSELLSPWEKSICPISSRLALSDSSILSLFFCLRHVFTVFTACMGEQWGSHDGYWRVKLTLCPQTRIHTGMSLKLISNEIWCLEAKNTEAARVVLLVSNHSNCFIAANMWVFYISLANLVCFCLRVVIRLNSVQMF